MQHHYIPSGKNKIAVYTDGNGPALCFLHAGGLDHQIFLNQAAYFKHKYMVILPDLRGHGDSNGLDNTLYDYEDVSILLEEFQIAKCSMIGVSLGAAIALDFAFTHPEKLDKLVLVSPGLSSVQNEDEEYTGLINQLISALQNQEISSAIEILSKLNYGGNKRTGQHIQFIHQLLSQYITYGINRMPAIREQHPLQRLNEINIPCLVITGADDHNFIKKNAALLVQGLPIVESIILRNAAHLPCLDLPDAFNEVVDRFLNPAVVNSLR